MNWIPPQLDLMGLLSEDRMYTCGVESWKLHGHDTGKLVSHEQTTTNTQGASVDWIITGWREAKRVKKCVQSHTYKHSESDVGLRIKPPLYSGFKQRPKRHSSQRCWVTRRKEEKRLKEKDEVAPSKGRDSVSLLLPAAWQLKLGGRSLSPSASF